MVSQEYHLSVFFFLLPLHQLLYFSSADDGVIMAKLSASFTPAPSDWTGKSYCNWSGITCDSSNNVTSINLPNKSLSGSLPYEIYQLSQLETIDVHGNSLSGPLPTFFNMRFLREIILDSNEFTLVPPNFLEGLGSLKTLSISDNSNLQSWQIPDSSGSTTFENFYASNSSIFGSIPDYFDSFPNLKNLRLSYNNITGVLPKSLRGSKIQNLWLNDQAIGLSGTIDVLSSMSQLSQVWLHGNAFTGQVPDLSNCTNLFDLQLDNNLLTGVLPPSLMELPKLINISLLNNKLQGEYPVFKSSVKTSIDTNNFCMKIPGPCDPQVNILLEIAKDFGYPLSLARAWTGNNACDEWTSVTCDSQGKRVQDLDFTEKHFSGKISPAFSNLTSLRNLLLRENNLTGAIPETLTTLDQLAVLDVSNNNLSGPVPSFRKFVKVICWREL